MTNKTGAEVIDIVERFNFNLGSAIDCIARAGGKTASGTIGDLERAQWYLEREIKRIKHYGESAVPSSQTSATRAASQVHQLGLSQQNGTVWQDRMGDKYRFSDGEWEYLTGARIIGNQYVSLTFSPTSVHTRQWSILNGHHDTGLASPSAPQPLTGRRHAQNWTQSQRFADEQRPGVQPRPPQL